MERTEFGVFMRSLRRERNERQDRMAVRLGVTLACLSAVETGKKNVPPGWVEVIAETYSLDTEQKAQLAAAVENSTAKIVVNMNTIPERKRSAVYTILRALPTITERKAKEIVAVLNEN